MLILNFDVSSSNFDDWPFLSVHFWGEQAHGRWTLEIINSGSRRINQPGILKKWQLVLYGTDLNPTRLRSRSLSSPSSGQYREAQSQGSPRFIPQDYLYPGASEALPQVQKPEMIRSQCRNEYWISDLAICVNDCPDGYFSGKFYFYSSSAENFKYLYKYFWLAYRYGQKRVPFLPSKMQIL